MIMYEAILDILDILEKKGNATIPVICQELKERDHGFVDEKQAVIETSFIETLVSSNNELFLLRDENVSIRPDKEPVLMTVVSHGYPGPEIRVRIDFIRNTFTYFEWHLDSEAARPLGVDKFGRVEDFKKQLYTFKLWEWDDDYQTEGIVLDGISWSVNLKTKGKTYESRGSDSFPEVWKEFCSAISKLIGKNFMS